jgi:DNA-directed RNA polymerase subunit RPC12/RpoP
MSETSVHEVVWISHKHDEHCAKCGKELGRGNFVQVNERDGVRCMDCCGYRDLCFLQSGDAKLTRLATTLSDRVVTVVKWSSARKRHERQGILVEEQAWDAVANEVERQNAAVAGKKGPKPRFKVVVIDGDRALWKQ